jgi:hypothetical protein
MQLHAVAGRLRTVGGGGEWATGADDDDDHEDACVAETWRGGGVLREANAWGRWHVSLAALFASSASCIRVVSLFSVQCSVFFLLK